MTFTSIDVTAIIKGQPEKLKYLGGTIESQEGLHAYISDDGLKRSLEENDTGVDLLIILYIIENCINVDETCWGIGTPEQLQRIQEHCKDQKFGDKWFDNVLYGLDECKFPNFDHCEWVDESDNKMEYYFSEDDIKLNFTEPTIIKDFPVFVKDKYFDDLKKDLYGIYYALFNAQN